MYICGYDTSFQKQEIVLMGIRWDRKNGDIDEVYMCEMDQPHKQKVKSNQKWRFSHGAYQTMMLLES